MFLQFYIQHNDKQKIPGCCLDIFLKKKIKQVAAFNPLPPPSNQVIVLGMISYLNYSGCQICIKYFLGDGEGL